MSKRRKSVQVIRDPLIEPFFITKDEFSFALKREIESNPNHRRSKGTGKTYEKTYGYYHVFEHCIREFFKYQKDTKDFDSIKEYVEENKKISKRTIEYVNKFKDEINSKV